MTSFISPGVYSVERDLSAYVTDLSATIVGIVGTAEKGPTNSPILITSQKDFTDTFGPLNPKHYLGYAALSYLKKGSLLWVTRVSATDSEKAICATLLPSNYTPYAGDWTLTGESTTALTLALTDSSTSTGVNKTIVLGTNTVIPNFNPTDSAQTGYANDLIGSDFGTFVAHKQYAVGNYASITLGAGKGVSATIKDIGGTSSDPTINLPVSAFPSTNSPSQAYAVGSISFLTPGSWTAPSNDDPLIVLGFSNTLLNDTPIKLTYITSSSATLSDLTSSVEVTKLNALESLVSITTGSKYEIGFNLLNPTVTGNNIINAAMLKAILSAVLYVVNKSTAPSQSKLAVLYADLRTQIGTTGVYGLGSIDAAGNSLGFKSVNSTLDSLGNIVSIRLESLVKGVKGTFAYSAQTPSPVSPLLVSNQTISGSFTTGLYRPTWAMIEAGTAYVPTVLKFSSIGEADSSNTAITVSMDINNQTASKLQNYTIRVYERISSSSIAATSVKYNDFTLVEQYDGTIEGIQSNIEASSRRISMKIDFTTADIINMTTGSVTPDINTPDSLVFNPVFLTSETNVGITEGTIFATSTVGYDKTLTTFLSGGSIGSPISKNEIIGDSSESTGLYSFANPEVIDINVLLAPGWSADPAVGKAMTAICETRGDAIALLDTPFGLNVQNVVNYRKNIQNINSSYAATYYPWVKITDSVNKKDIYVPPSGQVAAQYAYNDQVADVYYAPAGRTRGTLTEVLSAERLLTQGDRDILAMSQINPIHTEAGYGIYIKGQQTLQSTTTALDRVNVRRLLLKLRKVVATASKAFEFEPGDSTTAYRLKQVAETILEDHLRKGAIQSYTVDVGPNVNTVLVRENNELRMEINLIPVKTAEKIIEVFSILPQGGGISLN